MSGQTGVGGQLQAPVRPRGGPIGQPAADLLNPRQRRWTLDALAAFQLRPTVATERVLASSLAVAERVDRATFQPGQGNNCASYLKGAGLKPGEKFNEYLKQLAAFEKLPPPRTPEQAAPLKAATQAAIAAYGNLSKPVGRKEVKVRGVAIFGQDRQENVRERAKLASCQETLAQLETYDLKAELQALAGKKPLDSAGAMRAAAAGVKLDLLSLPPAERQATPLDGADKGVSDTLWINKTGHGDAKAKSFICKPMLTRETVDNRLGGAQPGIPPTGGEVAREALVGRAAELLKNALQLDMDVPETHVVSLGRQFFPEDQRDKFDGPEGGITASVQEVRTHDKAMTRASQADRARVPKAKAHALAILDMVTLNGDRHAGNLLMEGDNPIPIDHGVSLFDPAADRGDGLYRVAQAMATDHNILLSLPSMHEPMDPTMIGNLKKLAPDSFKGTLKQERDTLVQNQPSMAGKVTDAALEPPRLVIKFLARAAAKAPTLSPASIQVAMGQNAPALFAPGMIDRDFNKMVDRILADAVRDQDVTKEVCLLNGTEVEALNADLAALGWRTKDRHSSPASSMSSNPALAMKIAAGGMNKNDPVDLKMQAEPDVPAPDHAKALEEIKTDQNGIYKPAGQVVRVAGDPSWNAAAEYKAHRMLMKLPPEQVIEVKALNLVDTPYTPMKLLTEVRRLEAVRATAQQNEANVGGDPWLGVRPKLIELKKKAAETLAGQLPAADQRAASAAVRQAARQPDPLDALSKVSASLFKLMQDKLYAAAERLTDADAKKKVTDATDYGAIAEALGELAQAGGRLQ